MVMRDRFTDLDNILFILLLQTAHRAFRLRVSAGACDTAPWRDGDSPACWQDIARMLPPNLKHSGTGIIWNRGLPFQRGPTLIGVRHSPKTLARLDRKLSPGFARPPLGSPWRKRYSDTDPVKAGTHFMTR